MRALARRDLGRALEMGLYMSNSYVLERGQRLFDRSRRTYEWIKRLNDDMGRNANAV